MNAYEVGSQIVVSPPAGGSSIPKSSDEQAVTAARLITRNERVDIAFKADTNGVDGIYSLLDFCTSIVI